MGATKDGSTPQNQLPAQKKWKGFTRNGIQPEQIKATTAKPRMDLNQRAYFGKQLMATQHKNKMATKEIQQQNSQHAH